MLDKTTQDWRSLAADLEIEGRAFANGQYQDALAGETRATMSPANGQKLADVAASYFVQAVVLIAAVAFIVWALIGPEPAMTYALINAVAVLIGASTVAEYMFSVATLAADMHSHVFDNTQNRNIDLAEHFNALLCIQQCDILRCCHNDGAGNVCLLRQSQLNIARAGGHNND